MASAEVPALLLEDSHRSRRVELYWLSVPGDDCSGRLGGEFERAVRRHLPEALYLEYVFYRLKAYDLHTKGEP